MSLISPNFDVKLIFFPNFGQGPFPKIVGKGPVGFKHFVDTTYRYVQPFAVGGEDRVDIL